MFTVEDKKGKFTIDEVLVCYKTMHRPQGSLLYQVSRKDMDWIMAKISPERLFQSEIDIKTVHLVLSMIEDVCNDIDVRVLANFPKMMTFALENKDSMYQEVLKINFQMIIDCM